MFIDARELEADTSLKTDVCIIGGGAAGVTLARELAGQKFKVLILESGGLSMDPATQQLQKVINVGRNYPKLQRLRPRFLGGATNLWGGHLVPLRGINFEKMEWMAHSGWPFGLETLLPYYDRAAQMLRINGYDHRYGAQQLSQELGIPTFPFQPDQVESVISHYLSHSWNKSPSVAHVLYDEIKDTPNVTFYLHANVTSLSAAENGTHLQKVKATTLKGNRFEVNARQFILATGGIENARLMLASNDVIAQGIGNSHDLVGRYFMEHITYINGAIVPHTPQPVLGMYGRVMEHNGMYSRCHIALPEHKIRELGIPDFRSEVVITHTLHYTKLDQILHDIHEYFLDFHVLDRPLVKKLRAMMGNLSKKDTQREPQQIVYRLSNYVEQVPNPLSRITLSDKRDALGLPIAKVDWQLSGIDRQGIRSAHEIIAAEVDRCGFGKMELQLPEMEAEILAGAKGGAHHMGTTRMHDSSKEGVVDANCRIHGMENFYIAGSSVFPTGGYANPTFTILAMTIRLADQMKKLLA